MAGALIVTAELGDRDHSWLDRLRRSHYPPDRNRLPAHLTMFHALPPSTEDELRNRLSTFAEGARPLASIAFRVVSPDLDAIRAELSRELIGLLSAQDAGGWRPHVTIQNKVAPRVAKALINELEREFRSRPLIVKGLGLHRYMDGPWEGIAVYPFRGA